MEKVKMNLKILSKESVILQMEKKLYFNKMDYKESKELLPLKDKYIYPARKIFHGPCPCKKKHEGKSKRNITTRGGELNNATHDSEPLKHLNKDIEHACNWKILINPSKHTMKRKNLQEIYIILLRPSLNSQSKPNEFLLFRNCIT